MKAKREQSDEPSWMVFRLCECPRCRGLSEDPCELRGGWFFGPGAKEREGQRPYWATRKPATWAIKDPALVVHYCDWSSQPDIHILCTDRWTTPFWARDGLTACTDREGVYRDDEGGLYSFEITKVDCAACLHAEKALRKETPWLIRFLRTLVGNKPYVPDYRSAAIHAQDEVFALQKKLQLSQTSLDDAHDACIEMTDRALAAEERARVSSEKVIAAEGCLTQMERSYPQSLQEGVTLLRNIRSLCQADDDERGVILGTHPVQLTLPASLAARLQNFVARSYE